MKHIGSGSINLLGTTEEASVERTRSRTGSRIAETCLHEGSITVRNTGALSKCSKHQKELAKDATVPVLVRYVIDGDYTLQDFGEDGVSHLSKEDFDTLATGEEEANIGVNLRAWSVVKLE